MLPKIFFIVFSLGVTFMLSAPFLFLEMESLQFAARRRIRTNILEHIVTDSRQGLIRLLAINLALTAPECKKADMLQNCF